MAFMAYRQQTMALGLAVLLIAAVLAPACVMFAQPAMAMPVQAAEIGGHHTAPAPPSQDCDVNGNLVECPHASPSSSAATAPRLDVLADAALPAVSAAVVAPIDLGPVEAPASSGLLPPPAHLTPLRL